MIPRAVIVRCTYCGEKYAALPSFNMLSVCQACKKGSFEIFNDTNFDPTPNPGAVSNSPGVHPTAAEVKTIREDVFARFDALDPDFLTALANIGGHAAEKYGSWEQFKNSRLEGGRGPINHALAHVTMYRQGMNYDRFDGNPRWHLIAAAYNLMMEYWYSLHPEVEP